jgi:glutathione S-transferase
MLPAAAGVVNAASPLPGPMPHCRRRRDWMNRNPRLLLHWSPRSPYVRKVMIAAHETGVEARLDTVRTMVGGTTPHLELMHDNPLGKLPTLILPDGTALYDSYVIIEYFDMVSTGTRLIPPSGQDRLLALRRHALGNGMLDVLLQWLGERGRPEERQSAAHIALWRTKIEASTEALEQDADHLTETPFGIGHLAIGVALGYLDFRFPALDWRKGHGRLKSWYETNFNTRASVQAHAPAEDPA